MTGNHKHFVQYSKEGSYFGTPVKHMDHLPETHKTTSVSVATQVMFKGIVCNVGNMLIHFLSKNYMRKSIPLSCGPIVQAHVTFI